jgi:acyl-CoA synthetase (AMP-forming)/AMP-acid ligase II
MIIRGGENIYPREIEEHLFTHPGVAEVAVVGMAHAGWGEQVVAVIRPVNSEIPPTPEELRAHCRSRLASFKTPEGWCIVDELPSTLTGKVQKFVLSEQLDRGDLSPIMLTSHGIGERYDAPTAP